MDNLTLLFTDIEGSTQLWEKYPEAMKLALARHDSILRQAIESRGGHVFKTVGDAFYAAFASAPGALSAALDAQRALHAAKGEPAIRVRMGLHSGAVEARDNDYFGPPLNRVARLMAAGHGGQTLLSAAAREQLYGQLPAGVELRDMGERRLKDLTRPEHIYQLLAPDLPAEFPPLRALDAFRTNLPAQLTSFIGREKEIAAVKQHIATHRLTTLTGPGGTGKTRLSLQVAADLLDSFPDGVWFIEFAPLADPALLPQTTLSTLGLREEPGRSLLETLTDYLREKKALLILDNCEHLIEAAAQLAETLLQDCPTLRLLVSSREALGIPGETAYRVPSLAIPDPHKLSSVDALTQYEAVRLFVERAQTALPAFVLTDENARAIAQICARLDGIPLAIELAAARVKILKAEQIAERLDDRFRLLTGGSRTALPRQQTLRALIDWSYDLLSVPERILLGRLSIFAGGWTLEAAETVTSGQFSVISNSTEHWLLETDILDLLMQLVNKSLVVVDDDGSEARYRMLETIRQYAREKSFEAGDGEQIRDQHLRYFMQLAERAEPEFTGPQQVRWMNRLETELDNLRAALEWSLERDVQAGLRLSSALRWFWITYDYFRDGNEWLSQLLFRPQASARTVARAKALIAHSLLLTYTDDSGAAAELAREGLAIYQELGDKGGIADSLLTLASSADTLMQARDLIEQGLAQYREIGDKPGLARALGMWGEFTNNMETEQAIRSFEQSLAICRELGHLAGIGTNLIDLGSRAIRQGQYDLARAYLDEALEINHSLGKTRIAQTLMALGDLEFRQGRYEQARVCLEEVLSLMKENGQVTSNTWNIAQLGHIALRVNHLTTALGFLQQGLRHFYRDQNTIGIVYSIEGFASLTVLQGQPQRAAQLLAWADLTRMQIGDARPLVEQADVDRDLAAIHSQLDDAAFAAAQNLGRAMSLDEAVAFATEA